MQSIFNINYNCVDDLSSNVMTFIQSSIKTLYGDTSMFTKQYSVCALQRNMNINIGEYVDLDVTVKKKKKKILTFVRLS